MMDNIKNIKSLTIQLCIMTFLTLLSLTCVDVDDDNPEYLESILLGIGESVDLTGTWALTWDWYCDGEDVGSLSGFEFYADGTTNFDAVWSAYTGTIYLTTDGCAAVNYSYNAQFMFDSTGTIYYLMVDGDEAGGPMDDYGDGTNDGESEMIRVGSGTGSSITVTSPNGGETWAPGSNQDITWLSSGTSVYVDIYLYKNGNYYSTIYNSTSNDGNYTWSIPSSHIASENYQVKIVDYVDPEFYDLSDDYFTIEADAVDVILHYDDGGNNTGIGLNDGGLWYLAARWESSQLTAYGGMYLSEIHFFPRDIGTDYVLRVWTGSNASTLVMSQSVSPTINQWNQVQLNTPVALNVAQELWIGYSCDEPNSADTYPAGHDAGPAVAGYGDMIKTGSSSWVSMSEVYPSLDYNWNIQGVLTSSTTNTSQRTILLQNEQTKNISMTLKKRSYVKNETVDGILYYNDVFSSGDNNK